MAILFYNLKHKISFVTQTSINLSKKNLAFLAFKACIISKGIISFFKHTEFDTLWMYHYWLQYDSFTLIVFCIFCSFHLKVQKIFCWDTPFAQ